MADPLPAGVADLLDRVAAAAAGPALLTQPASWKYVGLSRSAWFRARSAGKLPRPVTVPGTSSPMWRRRDLDAWLDRLR